MKKMDEEKVMEILNNMAKKIELSTEQLEKMNRLMQNIEFALNRIADVLADIEVRSDGK